MKKNMFKPFAVLYSIISFMFIFSVSSCTEFGKPVPRTPTPLQVEGWEGFTVSRLCLKVEQSYPQIEDEFSQPIAERAQGMLQRFGVQVVDEGELCDATLTFTVTLRARSASYMRGGRYVGGLYTGASADGQIKLTGEGKPTVTVQVGRTLAPSRRATGLDYQKSP